MSVSGRRRENLHELLDPKALFNLPEPHYWDLLQVFVDDLINDNLGSSSDHERAYARFSILAQSVFCGACWPGAEGWLSNFSYQTVKIIIENAQPNQVFLLEKRKGLSYPIFIHQSVEMALLLMLSRCMELKPTRNGALRQIPQVQDLAPYGNPTWSDQWRTQYRRNLVEEYLQTAAKVVGLSYSPKLYEFQAAGRWLLTCIYPLDVVYALLGGIDITAPPLEQLCDPGPAQLISQLTRPMRER